MIEKLTGKARPRGRLTSLLGLALDGNRLEGVVLSRTNGSVKLDHSLAVTLSLDPLTNAPELVGREVLNHLKAAGIRERRCVLALPLKWALTAAVTLPDLPAEEMQSFLEMEAERLFPCDVETLMVARSLPREALKDQHGMLIGMPRAHVERLERVLAAAQLRPVSFTLGLSALQPPENTDSDGVLALEIGDSRVSLQASHAGAIVALRTLEGAVENRNGQRVLNPEVIAREVRITLGQLPPDVRPELRRIRIFGPADLSRQLADELELRFESFSLQMDEVKGYKPAEFGVGLPPGAAPSAAFSLAAWPLAGRKANLEFLAPKVSRWQQLSSRHASGPLRKAGLAAAAVVLILLAAFAFQQFQLVSLQSQWAAMKPRANELSSMQQRIRQFRPWFDESYRSLSILKQITAAFPEDGSVSAKILEIRSPDVVSCTGVAKDNRALLRTLERLRADGKVADLKVDRIQGNTPMQFTFDFKWVEGGRSAD